MAQRRIISRRIIAVPAAAKRRCIGIDRRVNKAGVMASASFGSIERKWHRIGIKHINVAASRAHRGQYHRAIISRKHARGIIARNNSLISAHQ